MADKLLIDGKSLSLDKLESFLKNSPDVELTKYLSDINSGITTHFSGSVEWNTGDTSYNLAMLESLEENHGDG